MKYLKRRFWRRLARRWTEQSQSENWAPAGSFRSRQYGSYEQYRDHQRSKLATLTKLEEYGGRFRPALRERLQTTDKIRAGINVLCLGARAGTECQAFIELGCFAIGIDLNPGPENRYVVTGDFHDLQFADRSVDCVYTNALDHAFALDKVFAEVKRVLKPEGVFIADIVLGPRDQGGRGPGKYESLWWETSDAVVQAAGEAGFALLSRRRFDVPWNGEQVVLGRA